MSSAACSSGFQAPLLGRAKTLVPVKGIAVFMLTALIVGAGICGCGYQASTPPSGSNPTTPTASAISPTSAVAGSPAFTLTVLGANFNSSSTITFGSAMLTTTLVDSNQLTAVIPAAAIASTGTATVTVTGTSISANFTITGGTNPIPVISSFDPICAPSGAQAFTLSVLGSNFVAGSLVRWNGSDRPTHFFAGGEIDASIPASDIATTGTATITVFNPIPGGGSSNSSTLTVAAGGAYPQSVAVDPTGRFAYVANEGCPDAFEGDVSMYSINPTDGTLTSAGPPVTTGDFDANSVAIDPSGKFVYVANGGGGNTAGSLSMYTISSTSGTLTPMGTIQAPCAPPPSPGSCSPWSVAVHPSGKFVYAANEGGFAPTSVSMYAIDATTGALGFIGTVAAEGRAVSVTIDPTGKFAYVVNEQYPGDLSGVSMYTINATTGVLTSTGSVPAGTSPTSVAVDPTGKFAYVTSGLTDILMYTIDGTTGALTSLGTITGGGGPIVIHPTGKFAYAGNSLFAIDPTTGFLTFLATTGAAGSSMAIHPSGKFAYVTNSGSNDVSIFSIDATTGGLTLIGTIGT